jgi:hypothetical protein
MQAWRLWLGAGLAHLCDIWTTGIGLQMGGHEANPLGAAVLGSGLLGLAILKAGGLAVLAGVWTGARRAGLPVTWVVPLLASVGGLVPATWNATQILLAGGVL